MTRQFISTERKLQFVEELIIWSKRRREQDLDVLKSIAADLRGRLPRAPSVAAEAIERRLASVKSKPGGTPEHAKALIGAGEELVGRWETIRQALEMFGDKLEGRDDAN